MGKGMVAVVMVRQVGDVRVTCMGDGGLDSRETRFFLRLDRAQVLRLTFL
jgi:hypothetical protein